MSGRGRPAGSKGIPKKSWVYDQLIERKFDVLDEMVELFRSLPDTAAHHKIEVGRILCEYALPKLRPVDHEGDTEGPATFNFLAVTDEQAKQIAANARLEHEKESKGES